jgi:hypothetical protein
MQIAVWRELAAGCSKQLSVVDIPDRGDAYHEMWLELMRLSKQPPAPWTLIGAHMVALHGWMRARDTIRTSKDADILVDVRVVSQGTAALSQALLRDGYELNERSLEGHGHSFAKGEVSFDVLAPDGVGTRAQLVTVENFRTVRVPGGSQALHRTSPVAIRSRSVTGTVPLPDLLGAILVKVRAIDVDDEPAAQRSDVAVLLSLIKDPDELVGQITGKERGWLRQHPCFGDMRDTCWRGVVGAEDGANVYRRLAET